ncbi:MAG: hypothetical protein E7161_03585 [Firmicutes bacterium]|nr:hypothetical protein [Bacillota bacterium]
MSAKKVVATKNIKSSQKKKTIEIDKYISPKNYLYAILILLGGIILTLYIFEWYQVKKEEKLMTSYLISSKTIESSIEDLNSLNQIRQEAPSSYFIYISYTGDEEIYNLEKDFKRVIDKYKLNDMFYYVDLTKLKNNNENYLNEIKNSLGIKDLKKIPALIYVHEGKILESNVLDGINDTLLKAGDLENLLDIYEFETVK